MAEIQEKLWIRSRLLYVNLCSWLFLGLGLELTLSAENVGNLLQPKRIPMTIIKRRDNSVTDRCARMRTTAIQIREQEQSLSRPGGHTLVG